MILEIVKIRKVIDKCYDEKAFLNQTTYLKEAYDIDGISKILDISLPDNLTSAQEVGSDVPFFINGKPFLRI